MSNQRTMDDFYAEIKEEVQLAADADASGWEMEDFLTSTILDYLEEAGEVSEPILCPFRGYGLQLNAYAVSEDYASLDLFVTQYCDSDTIESVSQTDVDAAIKRAINLYRKAINDLYTSFEKDTDTYEFAHTLHEHKDDIKTLRVIALTNGKVKQIPFKSFAMEGAMASFGVWDIDRLYRCTISGKMRETIEIDFQEKFGTTIPCIENCTSDKYSVYLAIISGSHLAALYDEHRDRLLEKNVRSFLSVKGSVNKGIRDTLKNEPDMFLAYNNGISVTAEHIDIVRDSNGNPSIQKIRDMQIVNGGQTTASIFNAWHDKKIGADLSKVFVQMKISVISQADDMDEIVPRISEYANTQNKVQIADFSANDPYHRKVEELSRTIWTAPQNGELSVNWFYERARGQYSDMLAQESTPKRKKEYKATHPVFTKTDLAKYENTWDQMPYYVSEGAQKNFRRFTVRLNEHKIVPDEQYYKNLIAKAILFKETEKIVTAQNFGGYRANIVTYTIAYLSFKTSQRIDLENIWKYQKLPVELAAAVQEVSVLVHQVIVNAPGAMNISEWCKKEKCWDAIKEIKYTVSDNLSDILVDVSYQGVGKTKVASIASNTEDEKAQIERTAAISATTWFALSRWAKETQNFAPWQRGIIFSVGKIVAAGKKPSIKQSVQALKVYDEAVRKGFTVDM